jgi:HEAT repeat protein
VALRLAIRALCRYGRRAAPAVPALGRLCGHPHAPVRADAAAALGEIRIGAEIVIPELIKLLADQDRFVLLATTATLQGFAHLARQAQSALQGLTGHEDPAVQAAAKRALQAVSGTAGK